MKYFSSILALRLYKSFPFSLSIHPTNLIKTASAMTSFNKQIWLTSALTDTDVTNALSLCISLRRTATSRKIWIIVSPRVAIRFHEALRFCFDFVLFLPEDLDVVRLKESELVKLIGLTLNKFETCVLLSPNMLALRNCDELFDWAELNVKEYASTKDSEMSVFVIRPSLRVFKRLLEESGKNVGTGLFPRMNNHVEDKYNRNLLDESELLFENGKDILMVNVPLNFGDELEKHSLSPLSQLVVTLWKNIHLKNIQPWLKTLTTFEMKIKNGQPEANDGFICQYPDGITETVARAAEISSNYLSNLLICSSMERPIHIIKISAETDQELLDVLEKYTSHLMKTGCDFRDFAYKANTGRADFCQRAILIAKSSKDAIRNIQQNKLIRGSEKLGKICFLFPGQGTQYPGMARELYQTSPVFRMHFDYCDKILKDEYNIDMTQVLWSGVKSDEVNRTIFSVTSILSVEYALLKLWESWGVKPDYALGHSLGESAAAVCAGILSIEDTIKLVVERARLIDQLSLGKMLVIMADKSRVDKWLKEFADGDQNKMLDVAVINSHEQVVIAGDSEVVQDFGKFCKENYSIKCVAVQTTHAFHSKHMDPMLDDFGKIARPLKYLGGNGCKYISGMRGTVIEADQVDAEYWAQHCREKVLFLDASQKAVDLGCRTFIEIGVHPVLSALTIMNNDMPLTCLASMKRKENEWETLLNSLGKLYVNGGKVDWDGFEN